MMNDFYATKDKKERNSHLPPSPIITTSSRGIVHKMRISSDDNKINQLDLAEGLKDLLMKHDLSLESILNTSPADLATTLGIDQQVAELICAAAKKQSKMLEGMR